LTVKHGTPLHSTITLADPLQPASTAATAAAGAPTNSAAQQMSPSQAPVAMAGVVPAGQLEAAQPGSASLAAVQDPPVVTIQTQGDAVRVGQAGLQADAASDAAAGAVTVAGETVPVTAPSQWSLPTLFPARRGAATPHSTPNAPIAVGAAGTAHGRNRGGVGRGRGKG
jgi:hypothetical protein